MRKLCRVSLIAACVSCATTPVNKGLPTHGVAYRGGLWFDGSAFKPMTMYVVDGVFRTRAPSSIDSTVDLASLPLVGRSPLFPIHAGRGQGVF